MGNRTKNEKKHDGKFPSKHVNHDPRTESAKAVFPAEDKNKK
ncbi:MULTISPECIES: CPC_1213 family protein [Caproicibacter]|nr:CPC_1213 family protein [Caproicibacter fermentans]